MKYAASLALLATALPLAGQDRAGDVDVAVKVTAVANRDVFLDRGRTAGLQPGDEVTLHPRNGASVLLRILTVSRSNSRAQSLRATGAIPVGTRGTVRIPQSRLAKTSQSAPKPTKQVPDHPPWQRPFGSGDQDKPLLAPVSGRTPEQRPMRIHGRTWLRYTHTQNREPVNQQYGLGSLGAAMDASNPFGHGGEIHFRGELTARRIDVADEPAESTGRVRLDRLSYRFGHATDGPRRLQAGRFLQSMFPELGLVDGIEADTQLDGQQRVGFSFGGFPEPFAARSTGNDIQAALLWRRSTEALDVGVAYQKTWHRGTADRDLLLANTAWHPTQSLYVYSSLWIDYYDSSELVESSGFELTEWLGNASYRIADGHGLALTVSHFRWPDLRRSEFRVLPAAILNDSIFRVSASSWHELHERVRLDVATSWWDDETQQGISANVGVSVRDLLIERSTTRAEWFRHDGTFDTGYGLRTTFQHSTGPVSYSIGYEWSRFELGSQAVGTTNQAWMATLQAMLTRATNLSLQLDHRTGDGQDTLTAGFYVQTRF